MPKFARPTSYNGRQATQQWTGDGRFATLQEALAGVSTNTAISPATMQVGTLSTLSIEGGGPIVPAAGNFNFAGVTGSGLVFSSPGAGQIRINDINTLYQGPVTTDVVAPYGPLIPFPDIPLAPGTAYFFRAEVIGFDGVTTICGGSCEAIAQNGASIILETEQKVYVIGNPQPQPPDTLEFEFELNGAAIRLAVRGTTSALTWRAKINFVQIP